MQGLSLNAQRIALDRGQRPIALPFGVAQVIFFGVNLEESEADLISTTTGLFAALAFFNFVPAFESHADVGSTRVEDSITSILVQHVELLRALNFGMSQCVAHNQCGQLFLGQCWDTALTQFAGGCPVLSQC